MPQEVSQGLCSIWSSGDIKNVSVNFIYNELIFNVEIILTYIFLPLSYITMYIPFISISGYRAAVGVCVGGGGWG
jgi:hypothetical protein